jgi:hypothetical protein
MLNLCRVPVSHTECAVYVRVRSNIISATGDGAFRGIG